MPTPLTVVLVHGALTDASVWHRVIEQLQRRGITVIAPSLPMRSFESDSAYLRSFLETIEGDVVVAAHSYAGAVISSPDALTTAVRALVFVAAFQADSGETAGELNGHFPGSLLIPGNLVARPYPGGTDLYVRPEMFGEVYAGDVDPVSTAVMAAAQHPFDPVSLDGSFDGTPTWKSVPTWSVVATNDNSIPTEALRFMAHRAGSTIVEIDSGHAVPVAHPQLVADTIAAAADAVIAE